MIGRRTANLGLPEAAGLAKPAAMTSPQEGRPAAPDSCGPAAAQAPEDRTIEIQAAPHITTAADPLPDDLRGALDRLHWHSGTH